MEQRTNLNPAIEEIVSNFIESNEKVKGLLIKITQRL